MKSRLINLLLALTLVALPGCLLGSPLAAFSGEPYGMVRDDIKAISTNKKGPIWRGAPVFAAIDLPIAFVLDTAFLPIALPIWAILSVGEDDEDWIDEDASQGRAHDHGGTSHTH